MSKFLSIKDYTFSSLSRQLEKFVIPPFQRPYAWRQKQISEVWASIISNEAGYFMGNIVLLNKSTETQNRYVIIDGQQRLLTISLLLLTIKNIGLKLTVTTETKNQLRENINQLLFYKEDQYPFNISPKILPSKQNLKKIYADLLTQKININNSAVIEELDENQLVFVKNCQLANNLVGQYLTEDAELSLEKLINKLTAVIFVAVICDSDSDAFNIFGGLNTTGVALSMADLLKNAILQTAKTINFRNQLDSLWQELENEFEQTKLSLLPLFLRQQWISKNGLIGTNNLLETIKREKLAKNKNDKEIKAYLEQVLNDAKIYITCHFDKNNDWLVEKLNRKIKDKKMSHKILELLKRFSFLDIETIYSLILAYLNKFFICPKYSRKQLRNDLTKLWIFSFRARVINLSPNEYEKKLSTQCVKITNHPGEVGSLDQISNKFYAELKILIENKEKFIANFPTEFKYGYDNKLITFILDTIYRQKDPEISFSRPTLEHILPQSQKYNGLNKEYVKDIVNEIGNLTLLCEQDNISAGNLTIKDKVSLVYSQSCFKMNNDLVNKQNEFINNSRQAVRGRGRELAIMAEKIFNY